MTLNTSSENTSISSETMSEICDFYHIEPVYNWVRNERGLVNDTFELDGAFFLTLYSNRTVEELENIARLAQVINPTIPLARPLLGRNGYCCYIQGKPTLLHRRLEGTHYVGIMHTDKHEIPLDLHRSLAVFFWSLTKELSITPEHLKSKLTRASRPTIGVLPDTLPPIALPLEKYRPKQPIEFSYPNLVHGDLERQNVLSVDGKITGLVDLDAIRLGDTLYEFSHFLFNFVFCDPKTDFSIALMYIQVLIESKQIAQKDIFSIYTYMCHFALSDIADFQDLLGHLPSSRKILIIDLELLVRQYSSALSFASEFFHKELPRFFAKQRIPCGLGETS